jgi:hypothetical protein
MSDRDKFKPGDRVVAGIHWGWIVAPCEYDHGHVWVALDIGYMRSFHWAECYAEADVVELE